MLDSAIAGPHAEEVLDSLTLGHRIRRLRLDAPLTLAQLAESVGSATSHLSSLENGKREAKLSELQSIARALGVGLDALISGEAPTGRAALKIALARAQSGPLFAALGIPPLPLRAGHVLGRSEPRDYAEFLTQRVETNYLAAALLIPEADAVTFLHRAKERRELAVEDLRDAFAVSYETAAHRFTNLATEHLGIPVHFLKVSPAGVLSKAYENDSVQFPRDALGAVEGQLVCRQWSARQVFDEPDRFSPYHQYTDKPTGTYWCTSRIESGTGGDFSISVGTPFAHVKWFRGRETTRRGTSSCPDPACCRTAPDALTRRWAGRARPQARIHASLLATLPTESFPGVDQTQVLGFLERHSPRP